MTNSALATHHAKAVTTEVTADGSGAEMVNGANEHDSVTTLGAIGPGDYTDGCPDARPRTATTDTVVLISDEVYHAVSPLLRPDTFYDTGSHTHSPAVTVDIMFARDRRDTEVAVRADPVEPLVLSDAYPSRTRALHAKQVS